MLILFLIYIIYKLNEKTFNRYKFIRYLKVFINTKTILVFITSAIISNSYSLYLNSKYESFYEIPPEDIKAEAIIVRRLYRKRI